MRIGVNTLFLVPGDVGGTEVYLRENLREMIPGNRQEVFVLFTTSDNDQSLKLDFKQFDNVEFVRLPFKAAIRPLRIFAEQTILPWAAWRSNIDVLWSPGYTCPLLCSCPQVVTVHDLQYKTHPEDLSTLERLTLDFLVKNACKRSASIIAVSEFSKSEIIRFNFAAENKIKVVHEGVNKNFGHPTNEDIFTLLGLPADTPFILCVAHTYPHKQVHVLVDAYGKIMDEIPHYLVLVGKPRRGEQLLQDSLAECSNKQRVKRVSDLRYEELIALYRNADLFVLPSVYEGFGLPVLEAMRAGTQVITCATASLLEVGGDHVVYFDKGDTYGLAYKIKETLGMGSDAYAERIENGRMWAEKFTWQKSAKHTFTVLRLEKK